MYRFIHPKFASIIGTFLLGLCHVQAQNDVCFTVQSNPFVEQAALEDFSKYINVLGCFHVLAESDISDEKILHVAAVTAELLDQNEDGMVDDQLLEAALSDGGALMPVLSHEGSEAEESLFDAYEGNGISAVLYKDEIDPGQPGHWGDDATVEEVLHTINHVGHVVIYPEAFSLTPNSSSLTAAMDLARGGQFIEFPDEYPDDAWYHYDDSTCDYECMAIEYLYWAIVTEMGLLDDTSTAQGIEDEWELYSADLLASTDVMIHALITDPTFSIPLEAPDGNYCPNLLVVPAAHDVPIKVLKVLNALGQEVPPTHRGIQFHLFENGTVKKVIADGLF